MPTKKKPARKPIKSSKVRTRKPAKPAVSPETILVLRTCNADMTSVHDGTFRWPKRGPVSCPDWSPEPKCGHGLHGFAKGEGDADLASSASYAVWLVVEVIASEIVPIGTDKVKFPRGNVLYAGDRDTATSMIVAKHPGSACIYAKVTAGDRGTATAGDIGTATAGNRGTATAGDGGTATAGNNGIIIVRSLDDKAYRYRIVTGYIGENGLEPNKPYHLVNGTWLAGKHT